MPEPLGPPIPLTALPGQGLVIEEHGGVSLVDLEGNVLKRLDGFEVDYNMQPASPTILLDRRKRAYLMLPGARRLKAISEHRRRSLWNMNDTVERLDPTPQASRVDGEVLGYWRWALKSPDGATLLAQWSGRVRGPECILHTKW